MENGNFWLSIIIVSIIFIILFLLLPKIIRLIDDLAEKKARAKIQDPDEQKKHRYKSF